MQTRTNVSKYRIETFIVLFSRLVVIYWISALLEKYKLEHKTKTFRLSQL